MNDLANKLAGFIGHSISCERNSFPIRKADHPDGLLRRPCTCGLDDLIKQVNKDIARHNKRNNIIAMFTRIT